MKMTLLQMVNSIMSDMDSDAVTSVADTVESGQVASTIKDVFYQMVTNQVIPEEEQLDRLTTVDLMVHAGALNYLAVPDNVDEVQWVKYNKRKSGDTFDQLENIKYCRPDYFMNLVSLNQSDATNVQQVTDPTSGVTYYVIKDQAPTWYTSFDDEFIAFNQFDKAIDTVQMVGTKSIIMTKIVPDFDEDDDTFVPLMDANLFPFLLAEAKSTCFVNLKQQGNPKIEKQSLEQRIRVQKSKYKATEAEKSHTGGTGQNYGRR